MFRLDRVKQLESGCFCCDRWLDEKNIEKQALFKGIIILHKLDFKVTAGSRPILTALGKSVSFKSIYFPAPLISCPVITFI